MARRVAKTRTVYRRAAQSFRRRASSAMGGGKNKLMNVAWGAAGGLAGSLAARFNGTWGPALGIGAVGYVGNNPTLLTLAGMSLGQNATGLLGGVTGGAGTGAGSGWY